jgi:dolichol-phosphate mannosyltransferase
MTTVSIIVPTLNEADNIDQLIREIFSSCEGRPFEPEIIVVDDGSTDGTRDLVTKWQLQHRVKLLAREGKRGLASATVDGAMLASGDVVVVIDADLSHPPSKIPELAEPVLKGTCDIAIGSRYIPGGSIPGWPLRRRFTSKCATYFAWPVVDVNDPMSGFFAVRRERLLSIGCDVPGYKTNLEILARGGDQIRAIEIPIEFVDRRYGQSKLGFKVIADYLRQLFALAGGNVSASNGARFAVVGVIGLIVDLSIFHLLLGAGLIFGAAHVISFFCATVTNYALNSQWSFKTETGAAYRAQTGSYLAFLLVALLGMLLRGGVLGSLTVLWGWPPQAAIIAAIVVAAGVNYIGNAFFIFTRESDRIPASTRWRIFALAAVGYSVLLRLVYIGLPELLQEEAYYWNYAMHPALGYLDHPPMVAWIIWLGTRVFGNTEFAIRIGAFACWIVAAFFIYRLSVNMFNKTTAILSLMLMSILPLFFGIGLVTTPDAPLVMCWAGALFFLERALVGEKRAAWWGAGVCIGLGMISKYTIVLLGPATFLYLLLDKPSRRWFLKPESYAAALCAALIFTPVVYWNSMNDWASFVFQGPRRIHGGFNFTLHLLVLSVLVILTPAGCLAVWGILTGKSGVSARDGGEPFPQRAFLFARVFALVPLAVFLVFSLTRQIKFSWTGPLWLVLVPFIAYQMAPGTIRDPHRLLRTARKAWPATVVVLMLLYGSALHYFSIGLPGVPYPHNVSYLGWKDLGRQIETVEDTVERQTGREPLVVGLDPYKTASGIAFYRTVLENAPAHGVAYEGVHTSTSGNHLFGGTGLMYRFWFPSGDLKGTTMIIVSPDRDDLIRPSLRRYFSSSGNVNELSIRKNSQTVGTYYYAVFDRYLGAY